MTDGTEQIDAARFFDGVPDLERGDPPVGGLTLDRTREILLALRNPQRRYPSVLIAGTNGKGSTAAMIERALRAAGLRTGLYTQPHLHELRERVRINGQPIDPDGFAEGLRRVREALAGVSAADRPTTAYEIMTVLALERFARAPVDVAVLEVGLGGRLDSTNVVDAAVSVITPISLDHTQILGDTIAAIAAEKADIIKPGRPCVVAPQGPEAMDVIVRTANARGARLREVGSRAARWDDPPRDRDLLTAVGRIETVRPALPGSYQRPNVATAVAALDALRDECIGPIGLNPVRVGIETAEWPGRFEVVAGDPPIVLDGAHNPAGASALADSLASAYPNRPAVFVLGVGRDKDADGIVSALLGAASRTGHAGPIIIATRAEHPRALDPAHLAAVARRQGASVTTERTVSAAVARARAVARPGDVVVIAGSLYVIAEAREAIGLAEARERAVFDPWATR